MIIFLCLGNNLLSHQYKYSMEGIICYKTDIPGREVYVTQNFINTPVSQKFWDEAVLVLHSKSPVNRWRGLQNIVYMAGIQLAALRHPGGQHPGRQHVPVRGRLLHGGSLPRQAGAVRRWASSLDQCVHDQSWRWANLKHFSKKHIFPMRKENPRNISICNNFFQTVLTASLERVMQVC